MTLNKVVFIFIYNIQRIVLNYLCSFNRNSFLSRRYFHDIKIVNVGFEKFSVSHAVIVEGMGLWYCTTYFPLEKFKECKELLLSPRYKVKRVNRFYKMLLDINF